MRTASFNAAENMIEDKDKHSDANRTPRQHQIQKRIVRDVKEFGISGGFVVLKAVAEEQQSGVVDQLVGIELKDPRAVGGNGVHGDGRSVMLLQAHQRDIDHIDDLTAEHRACGDTDDRYAANKAVSSGKEIV